MKLRLIGQLCIAAILLSACGKQSIRLPEFPPRDTSVISLIAQPEKYEGKAIIVKGFYVSEWETSALFPSSELSISAANGIWVDTLHSGVAKDLARLAARGAKWVELRGTFTAKEHGHTARWPGTLKEITHVSAVNWGRFEDENRANKSPEPTPTAVTPRATERKSK